jgi:hypothetical protein
MTKQNILFCDWSANTSFSQKTTQFKGKMERRKHNVSQQEKEDMALFSIEDGQEGELTTTTFKMILLFSKLDQPYGTDHK